MTSTNSSPSKDPLHGVTLEQILRQLEQKLGFDGLAEKINVKCFTHDPSIKSCLKFFRKTPWARTKLERLYIIQQGEKIPDHLRSRPRGKPTVDSQAPAQGHAKSDSNINAAIWGAITHDKS